MNSPTGFSTDIAEDMKPLAAAGPKSILVAMPFRPVSSPSIQIGSLCAIGAAQGFSVDALHLNLDFAVRVGRAFYEALIYNIYPPRGVGDWLFSKAAFGDEAPDQEGRFPYDFSDVVDFLADYGVDAEGLRRMREETVPAFLADAEAQADWSRYGIVGFSCGYQHQQTTASLALARQLKTRFPRLVVLFAGTNFEVELGRELVGACPWIDYAIDGEAEDAFPAFLNAVAQGRPPLEVPGVISAQGSAPRAHGFARIESLPIPEYGEFYQRAESVGLVPVGDRSSLRIPFESSRGCWWGQKHHCTFCGLNGSGMTFRQKSPERVLGDLAELARRHGMFRFYAADNIMPTNFFTEFIPALVAQERTYDLFYEVKANMNREQIKALHDAGVRYIQPGIESLSSHVLRLMNKGLRAAQNVNVLRWTRHHGMEVAWNLLWGFPGETAEDYEQQAALLPHLFHLQPPGSANRIWLERFSPLFFDRDRFPVESVEPEPSLDYVYPSHVSRLNVASFFEHRFPNELPETVFAPLTAAIAAWEEAWTSAQRPWLVYRWSPGMLQIEDGRNPVEPRLYSFESPLAEIYRAISDRPVTAESLRKTLDLPWSADDIAEALDLFVAKGLVMRDQELFLALALPAP